MGIAFVIFGVLLIALVFRLLAGGLDHDRVKRYVEQGGGELIQANWAPFGPGWFGEKSDRIYEVRYIDRDGNERLAHCKTSMLSGVYFTQDRIVRHAERDEQAKLEAPASRSTRNESLEAENRRLREELERLKRGGNGP